MVEKTPITLFRYLERSPNIGSKTASAAACSLLVIMTKKKHLNFLKPCPFSQKQALLNSIHLYARYFRPILRPTYVRYWPYLLRQKNNTVHMLIKTKNETHYRRNNLVQRALTSDVGREGKGPEDRVQIRIKQMH